MKPIFCTDVTQNKKNDQLNGSEFIEATVDSQKLEQFNSKHDDLSNTIKKSQLPRWLSILKYICAGLGAILVMSVVSTIVGYKTGERDVIWQNIIIMGVIGVVSLIACVALRYYERKRQETVLGSDEANEQIDDLSKESQSLNEDLGIPSEAISVDILMFRYKIKNEQIVPYCSPLQYTPYVNFDMRMYQKDDKIYLADLENAYSFKKDELRAIKTIDKKIAIPLWNKEDCEPTEGWCRQYDIKVNEKLNCLYVKPYHILEIEHEGEMWGIYFPGYEVREFEKITGLRAQDPQE